MTPTLRLEYGVARVYCPSPAAPNATGNRPMGFFEDSLLGGSLTIYLEFQQDTDMTVTTVATEGALGPSSR